MTSPERHDFALTSVKRDGGSAARLEDRQTEDEQFWAPVTDLPPRAAILATLEKARQSGKRAPRLS